MKKYNVLNNCCGDNTSDIIDKILDSRRIKDIDHFLYPNESDLLPLTDLRNIDKAYKRFMKAIENGEKIATLFDVDADGICSGTIITRYSNEVLNYPITPFINNGKEHGLKGQDLSKFERFHLLIIVDSLDSDCEQYKKIVENGTDIIILDHHKINPNIAYDYYSILVSSQDNYKNTELSGAGVCWKFIKYIDELNKQNMADNYMDLAAVGILADVMDVSEESTENRYIISQGLKNLKNPGLKKIIGSYEFNSKAVLFSVAPLINASMRIGRNEDAMNLFLSDENKELLKYKKSLEQCKELQNEEVDRIIPDIRKQFDSQSDSNILYAIFSSEYGISGLFGNKLLDEYHKPMFLLQERNGIYTGSMRSEGYGDFAELVNSTNLGRCDGHEQAAGIVIEKDNLNKLITELNIITNKIMKDIEEDELIDAEISLSDLNRNLIDNIKKINFISGKGFKPIKFKIGNIDTYEIGNFKQGKHLTISPSDKVMLIEWNTNCDFDEMEDHSLMNDPIDAYGELEDGFLGKTYKIKLILDSYDIRG